jgi:hypothetical protein
MAARRRKPPPAGRNGAPRLMIPISTRLLLGSAALGAGDMAPPAPRLTIRLPSLVGDLLRNGAAVALSIGAAVTGRRNAHVRLENCMAIGGMALVLGLAGTALGHHDAAAASCSRLVAMNDPAACSRSTPSGQRLRQAKPAGNTRLQTTLTTSTRQIVTASLATRTQPVRNAAKPANRRLQVAALDTSTQSGPGFPGVSFRSSFSQPSVNHVQPTTSLPAFSTLNLPPPQVGHTTTSLPTFSNLNLPPAQVGHRPTPLPTLSALNLPPAHVGHATTSLPTFSNLNLPPAQVGHRPTPLPVLSALNRPPAHVGHATTSTSNLNLPPISLKQATTSGKKRQQKRVIGQTQPQASGTPPDSCPSPLSMSGVPHLTAQQIALLLQLLAAVTTQVDPNALSDSVDLAQPTMRVPRVLSEWWKLPGFDCNPLRDSHNANLKRRQWFGNLNRK